MLTNQQKLKLAQNLNTPGSVLTELATESNEREILKAIASNPNSPPILLLELAGDYLSEIAENLALELIVIEQPDFIDRLYYSFVEKRFYNQLALPKSFLRWGVNSSNSKCRMAVGLNENIPLDLLEKLSQDPAAVVRASVASNPNTPQSLLKQLTKDTDSHVSEIARSSLNLQEKKQIVTRYNKWEIKTRLENIFSIVHPGEKRYWILSDYIESFSSPFDRV